MAPQRRSAHRPRRRPVARASQTRAQDLHLEQPWLLLLLLLFAFSLKLVLQVLHVVVGVVLKGGLRRLALCRCLLRGRLLAGRAEERRGDYQQRGTKIHEYLEVLLQHTLWIAVRAAQLRL
jgi:hypothetical protein